MFAGYGGRGRSPSWGRKEYIPRLVADKDSLCPVPEYGMASWKHFNYCIDPKSMLEQPLNNFWYPAMRVLSASTARISEIGMFAPDQNLGGCLSVAAFDTASPFCKGIRERFATLKKLRLDFRQSEGNSEDDDIYLRGGIASALSNAKNIEHLYIRGIKILWKAQPDFNLFSFRHILGNCQFPKLKILMLDSFILPENEFVDLLRGSEHLEILRMKNVNLRYSETWQGIAIALQQTLPALHHIVIQFLKIHGLRNARTWPLDALGDPYGYREVEDLWDSL